MRSTATPSTLSSFRRCAIIGGITAASVLAIGGNAIAQTTTASDSTTATGRPSPLTAEQRACLSAKGFGPKTKPAADSTAEAKTRPTEAERTAERAARQAAATACGVTLPSGGHRGPGPDGDDHNRHGGPGGPGGHRPMLTTEQQACLTAKGFVRPAAPAVGSSATKPVAPTADQRAALEAAAKACGINVPVGGGR